MTQILKIRDLDDQTFDPFDDGFAFGDCTDFWKLELEAWRKGGPVQLGSLREVAGLPRDINFGPDQKVFMIFDPVLIRKILNDGETFTKELHQRGFRAAFGNSLTAMDPPDHPRYRRIFQKAFLPGVIAEWSKSIVEPVINGLIDKFRSLDRTEIIRSFAFPYPFEIIYHQLALPESERRTFHKLAVTQVFFQTDLARSIEAGRNLGEYFTELIKQRRTTPGDDMVSLLATVEDNGERLPDDVVISFLRQLINAAGDTTYRSTGNMLVCLLRDRPDQYRLLVENRALIPAAVEETIRLYAPVISASRTTIKDVELGGVHVPKGSIVETITGLVGRHPELHDNPNVFDVTREHPDRHMGFSAGPHICLGQHLARLEMTRALSALLETFPDMRLDEDYPPPNIYGCNMLSSRQIHVRLR